MQKRLILAGLALFLVGAIDVMADEADGATGLHWASYHDDLERADQLIRAGAHVNAVNDLGVTPLWTACVNGSAAMVRRTRHYCGARRR
jgi:ankyrin repeat protein